MPKAEIALRSDYFCHDINNMAINLLTFGVQFLLFNFDILSSNVVCSK